jgi:ABC-2 type transport system ATP-binding protein
MLKLIGGMLRPSLGIVKVCGEAPFAKPGVMRRVGFVPEQDAVYSKAGVLDVVTYFTRLQGYTAAEARTRARRALERVGLGEVMGRSAEGFSKGMRQRAKLAQALAHEPDVLILDEPLNGLDPPGRREYSAQLSTLGEEGCCVLVSSHILHEVQDVARRIVVLHAGRVLAEGTAREIREDLSEFPLTVRVDSSEPRILAQHLVGLDGVQRVEPNATGVEVLTSQSAGLFERVNELAAEGRVPVTAIVPLDEDLEAVFRYLTQ